MAKSLFGLRLANNKMFVALFGTVIGQAIPMIFSPVLSRMLGPSVFGAYAAFISISTVLYVFITLTFDQAISVAATMRECKILGRLYICAAAAFALVLTPVLYVFRMPLGELLGLKSENWMIALIPLYALQYALYMGCYFFYIRWGDIKSNAKLKILMPIFVVVVNFVTALFYKGEGSLVVSQVAAYFALLLMQIRPVLAIYRFHIGKEEAQKESEGAFALAKKYRDYPIKFMPSTLLNQLSVQLPALLITACFGPVVGGYYALANRTLNMPISAVGTAFGDVYRNEAQEERQKGNDVRHLFLRRFKMLFLLGAVPFALLLLFSQQVFSFVFGAEWVNAGIMSSLMTPMYFAKFMAVPLAFTLIVYNKHSKNLILQAGLLVVSLLSFGAAVLFQTGWQTAIILYSAGFLIVYCLYLAYGYKISKERA